MNISNNISNYGNYSNGFTTNSTSPINNNYTLKNSNNLSVNSNDEISLSSKTSRINSLGLDKGTASNTTLFVDRNTFDKIVSYSANNKSAKWDELGFDGEKRWVVINGQRFECPLTEEEKEAYRRASMTIVDYFIEADKEKQKIDSKNNSEKVTITESNINNINSSNAKIQNLIKNEPVMNMLKDLVSQNGGNINLFS